MQIEMTLDGMKIRAEASWDSGQRGDGKGSASEEETIAPGWCSLQVWELYRKSGEKKDDERDITDELWRSQWDEIMAEFDKQRNSELAERDADSEEIA